MTAPMPDYFISHAGIADNPGIDKESLEAMRREFVNNPSQLAAREKGLFVRPEGLVLPFDPEFHFEDLTLDQAKQLLRRCKIFGGLDFGAWRFAFTLWAADPIGVPHLVEEHFSQREDLETRAKAMHEKVTALGIEKRFSIYGDCANPQDIMEINKAFARIDSFLRVTAVAAEKKLIRVGVTRLENLMTRRDPVAFKVRRTVGEKQVWKAGYGASSPGIPVSGSRWVWEVNNWQYPKNDDDAKSQKQEPDDNTADGADMMASGRYAIMSWWRPGKEPDDEEREAFSPAALKEDAERSRTIKHRIKRRREGPRREINESWGD